MAVSSEEPAEPGQWTYDFSDPDGPQLGTVALEGSNVISTAVDPVVMIAEHTSVTLTPSYHWSARGLGDRRMALWSGFWIETPKARVWFAGDTGYGDGSIFHDLRGKFGAPDIALIPIGAYEPRWFMAPQHVAPEEAVQIFQDIGAEQALGVHWGTFQLTDEPHDEPVELLQKTLSTKGIPLDQFRALSPGDVYSAA